MIDLRIIETIIHLTIPIALVIIAYAAYKIYKEIYGILINLWKPFQIIFIGLTPFTIFHLILAIENFFNISLIPTGLFKHAVEHFLILFVFIMIGYGLLSIRKTLREYGMLIGEVKKLKNKD